MSLNTSAVPRDWKSASVCPVPKIKRNAVLLNQYRPISLTSCACKVLESAIRDHLLTFCRQNSILTCAQFGFMPKKSTELQLLHCLNSWTESFDKNIPVDVVYLDFAKAFDSVSHQKLLHKLSCYGISDLLLRWIQSYLNGRDQFVKVGDSCSTITAVTSGVPQGSVLGPLLFCLFINDIVEVIRHCEIVLYADDVKLFMNVQDLVDYSRFQEDLDRVFEWSKANQIYLNTSKCSVLHLLSKKNRNFQYYFDGIPLPSVSSQKDLGVYIDPDLTFKFHRQKKIVKCNQTMGALFKCFAFASRAVKIRLYKCYVLPLLDYCSTIWSPRTIQDRMSIESIQRRFTKRLMYGSELPYLDRIADAEIDLLPIALKHLINDLVYVYRMKHNIVDCDANRFFSPATNRVRTNRGHSLKLLKLAHRVNVRNSFWSFRIVDLWNSFENATVLSSSAKSFRSRLLTVELAKLKEALRQKFYHRLI